MITARDLSRECFRVLGGLPDDLLSPNRRIGVYGTGFLGQWAVGFLRQNSVEPTACFDGNPDKQGTVFSGMNVQAPEHLSRVALDLVLITARHAVRSVEGIITRHGASGRSLDAWYVAVNFEAFIDIHDRILDDERSKETLRAVLMTMLTGDRIHLEPVLERDQYFCLPQFMGSEKESYVDAGAYVGDSIERFIWANAGVFEKIRAFEPSERQFAALEKRCERLKVEWALGEGMIEMSRAGLSASSMRMAGGTASGQLQSMALVESDNGDIVTVSLDAHLSCDRVTFIKADVEGMELQLLRGAAHTIRTFRPKLAICVYHYPSDIPEILAYIKALVPDYRFALRHHSPQLMETVLYCWVD